MRTRTQRIAAPATTPITHADISISSRTGTLTADDQTYVTSLIVSAVNRFERETGRALITQTWQMSLEPEARPSRAAFVRMQISPFAWSGIGGSVELRPNPVQSVTEILAYDTENNDTPVDTDVYRLDNLSTPARVLLNTGQSWPTGLRAANSMVVEYVTGYGDAAAVPDDIKTALRIMVANWWEHRESLIVGTISAEIPGLVREIMQGYRVRV